MTERIQITIPCYMQCDGQWQIVLGGVFDVDKAITYGGVCKVLSPAETAGALASHGKPTPVRNVKTR